MPHESTVIQREMDINNDERRTLVLRSQSFVSDHVQLIDMSGMPHTKRQSMLPHIRPGAPQMLSYIDEEVTSI